MDTENDDSLSKDFWKRLLELEPLFGENNVVFTKDFFRNGLDLYDNQIRHAHLLNYYMAELKAYKISHSEVDSFASEILSKIGEVYMKMGDFSKALQYHESAYEIDKKIHNKFHPSIATSLIKIGELYYEKGEHAKALQYFEKAHEINRNYFGEVDSFSFVAQSLVKIGEVYNKIGDPANALQYFEKALLINIRNHGEFSDEVAQVLNKIGELYNNKGDLANALKFHERALEIQKKRYSPINQNVALSYEKIGEIYRNQGNIDKALIHHEKALEISRIMYGNVHQEVAHSVDNIGTVYKKKGDFTKALQYYEKALEIFKRIYNEAHVTVAQSFNNIGLVYLDLEDFDKALQYLEEELKIFINIYDRENHNLIRIYEHIGFIHQNSGNLEKALTFYEMAIQNLWKTIQRFEVTEDRLRLIGDYFDIFLHALSIVNSFNFGIAKLKKIEKSHWIIEGSKASQLLQLFQDLKALRLSTIPDELISKDSLLQDQIRQYQINLDKAYADDYDKNKERISNLKDQLFDLQEEHHKFIKEIEQKYPRYYDLKYQTNTAEISDIQSVLALGEALLNYLLDTDKNIVYILYISKGNSDIKIAEAKNAIDTISNDFNACIKIQDLDGTLKNGSLLYEVLIDPVINILEEEKINKLVIIPDHILFNVPFEVLVPGKFFKDYNVSSNEDRCVMEKNIPYLIRDYAISYHFSATLFFNLRREKDSKAVTDNFIGFAPVFDDDFCRNFRLPDFLDGTDRMPDKVRGVMRGDRSLEPLPCTRDEVLTASKMFDNHSGPMLNHEAKKEAFISQIKDHNIVMVGTHGYYHRQSPELSGMIFYPVKAEKTDEFNPVSEVDPYILFTRETYNLPLQGTSLVILSCCETALGDLKRGEGIIGLSRGFLYSGSSSVACSLWKVNDKKTAELWNEFFSSYKEVSEPNYAILLQKAKIAMIAQGIDPFYWGAFVMIGRG
jgi:CHAT domain-containing protein/tetratricopeptide (TPR) repeat protein